jgi:hypothetical protein
MKDGFLLVHQYNLDNPSTFPFSTMKSWNWNNTNGVLLIRMGNGRVEIPREHISRLEIKYNTQLDNFKNLEDFVNREHNDGVV